MYNLFAHEKKLKEELNRHQKEEKDKQMLSKKKSQLDSLKENYKKRIKKFIFDMAEHPIKINDYLSPRDALNKERTNDPPKRSQSRERGIETLHKSRNKHFKFETFDSKDFSKTMTTLHQPTMRFKAKNDLERLADEINKYSYGRAPDRIKLNFKTKKIDLKMRKGRSVENDENDQSEEKANVSYLDNGQASERGVKTIKVIDKSAAQNLLSEYHNKTHFKAASDFVIFNRVGVSDTAAKRESPRIKLSSPRIKILKENYKNLPEDVKYQRVVNLKNMVLKDIDKDLLLKNPLLFNSTITKDENVDLINLEKIRQLSLKSTLNEEDTKNTKRSNFIRFLMKPKETGDMRARRSVFRGIFGDIDLVNFETKKEEEKIKIDDEEFLRSETQKIAQKVLTTCNYFHKKQNSEQITARSTNSRGYSQQTQRKNPFK